VKRKALVCFHLPGSADHRWAVEPVARRHASGLAEDSFDFTIQFREVALNDRPDRIQIYL